ncbi:glycosyltransferase [Winogradskyella sp. MIT101101]|uniref:glycosyltransferase n=1 Tax=Winogradskyella sp. MIT101101 TaxID=3098297 RepID=UPI003999D5E3
MRKNRSDAVHIMMCCSALAKHNTNVVLVTPKVKRNGYNVKFSEIFDLYGLEQTFNIKELPTRINEKTQGSLKFWTITIQKLIHFFGFFWSNKRTFSNDETIIYSQCYISAVPYILLRKVGLVSSKIVFTAASIKPKSYLHKFVIRNSDLIIAGLKYTVSDIIKHTGVNKEKFADTPLVFLSNSMRGKEELSKQDCRRELKFIDDKKYILYAGKTGVGKKSVEYFLECAKNLEEFNFVLVGANENTMRYYQRVIKEDNLNNLTVVPFLPLPEYYKYVKAADLLVDYYEATYYNKFYLGPGKSSSYFNSKNPVLFSDLPSLRHLFPEEIVFFVEPDNPKLLIKKVKEILQDEEKMNLKSELAYNYAQKHSFEYTMGKILNFCQSKLHGTS